MSRGGHEMTKGRTFVMEMITREERVRTRNYAEARMFLQAALWALDAVPRPWQNDCVAEAIDEIHRTEGKLTG